MILSSPKSLFSAEPSSTSSSSSRTSFVDIFPGIPRFSSWQWSSHSPEMPSTRDNKQRGFICPSTYRRRRNSSSSSRSSSSSKNSNDSARQLPSTIRTTPSSESAFSPAEASPDWKYATQGLHLLSTSISEGQTSPPLSRQLYIHSITYLLQALPQDLSPPESLSLQSALPPSLSSPTTTFLPSSPTTPPPPSLLHRILASTIIQLFLVIQLLLPYIRVLLQAAYRHEREYRVMERVLKGGVELVDGLLGTVSGVLGGGRGDLLGKMLGWWVKGICGGLQEGVGVGMARIGWGGVNSYEEKRK